MSEAIVDQLERASVELDKLIYDMRVNPLPSVQHYDAFEERAQAISGAIVVPFRGKQPPVAAPLHMQTDGDGRCRAIF